MEPMEPMEPLQGRADVRGGVMRGTGNEESGSEESCRAGGGANAGLKAVERK